MTNHLVNRRQALGTLGLSVGAALINLPASAKDNKKVPGPAFKYSLNMSTIRGQNLGFIKELQIAAKAGYSSVEIWINTFESYLQNGGSATEAKKIIDDLGIVVENSIGFAKWIVDDKAMRSAALTQLHSEMEALAKIGCKRIAAPPAGANSKDARLIDLNVVTERYLAILEIGKQTGVMPILEMWGSSVNLKKISEVLYVVTECGDKSARILMDIFHIFKGGSNFDSVAFVGKPAIDIIHLNDYPSGITPATISEPDRIYPGDGIAPIRQVLQTINDPDKTIVLSLELFNQSYYKQDALLVAQTGLAKMKAVAEGI
ncbi:MAG: sugar phosphate isomerase/epimerase family protein [Ginsengibacter sp.]